MGQASSALSRQTPSGRDDVHDVTGKMELLRMREEPLTTRTWRRLSDKLQPNTVKLSAEVKIVWLMQ